MRTETVTVAVGGVFLGVIGAVYWLTSYEPAGTTLLTVGALAYFLLAGYLYQRSRRLAGGRPEDREDATIAGSSGEVGYFPAASVWPAALGLGVVVLAVGLVFGPWLVSIGIVVTVGAIIGYSVEAQARY